MKVIGRSEAGNPIVELEPTDRMGIELATTFLSSLPTFCKNSVPTVPAVTKVTRSRGAAEPRVKKPRGKLAIGNEGLRGTCEICGGAFSKAGQGGYKKRTCDKAACKAEFKRGAWERKQAAKATPPAAAPGPSLAKAEDRMALIREADARARARVDE
jgi:hypothetical protein